MKKISYKLETNGGKALLEVKNYYENNNNFVANMILRGLESTSNLNGEK